MLTARQKEIFQYYYHEDLSYQEIADNLDISRASAFDTLNRTLKLLETYEENIGLHTLIVQLEGLNDERVNDILTTRNHGGKYD